LEDLIKQLRISLGFRSPNIQAAKQVLGSRSKQLKKISKAEGQRKEKKNIYIYIYIYDN
jgi:hypothetical protein